MTANCQLGPTGSGLTLGLLASPCAPPPAPSGAGGIFACELFYIPATPSVHPIPHGRQRQPAVRSPVARRGRARPDGRQERDHWLLAGCHGRAGQPGQGTQAGPGRGLYAGQRQGHPRPRYQAAGPGRRLRRCAIGRQHAQADCRRQRGVADLVHGHGQQPGHPAAGG